MLSRMRKRLLVIALWAWVLMLAMSAGFVGVSPTSAYSTLPTHGKSAVNIGSNAVLAGAFTAPLNAIGCQTWAERPIYNGEGRRIGYGTMVCSGAVDIIGIRVCLQYQDNYGTWQNLRCNPQFDGEYRTAARQSSIQGSAAGNCVPGFHYYRTRVWSQAIYGNAIYIGDTSESAGCSR